MLGNRLTALWLTPHAVVARVGERGVHSWTELDESFRFSFCFKVDGKGIVALARSPEHLFEICQVVLRLLAASVIHSVILCNWRSCRDGALINAASLAYLMEQCQSLKGLTLGRLHSEQLALDENHCRALGTYSRPGLEIELICCKFTSAGTSALAEVLGRNQGPTKLTFCDIDYPIFTDKLRENSRLKSLTPSISSDHDVVNREVLAIAGALKRKQRPC
jgi:hypothetical protein